MNDIFKRQGTLKAVLGRGVIAAWELSRLKTGDTVIITDRLCGEPVSLYFNDQLLGLGDLILCGNRICFRFVETTWQPSSLHLSESAYGVVEILETELVICERRCSLEDLLDIGFNSVIDLGFDPSAAAGEPHIKNVTLLAGGIQVAQGPCVIKEENWAIQISEIPEMNEIDLPVRVTRSVNRDGKEKLYDFSRPDRFSINQIMNAKSIHERFIKTLSEYELIGESISVYAVDQLNWGELVEYGHAHRIQFEKCLIAGNRRQPGMERILPEGRFFLPAEDLVDTEDAAQWNDTFRNMAADQDQALPFGALLIAFQGKKAAVYSGETEDSVNFLQYLEDSWRGKMRVQISLREELADFPEDFLNPYEMILLVTLKVGASDYIHLVYPYLYLQKILHLLG